MKSKMRSDNCDAAGLERESACQADRQLAQGLTFSATVTALLLPSAVLQDPDVIEQMAELDKSLGMA